MAETTSRVAAASWIAAVGGGCGPAIELAERLEGDEPQRGRRDVDRLRDLGCPCCTPARAAAAGLQLGAGGAAPPPLLLDPDEAVAMAVCLRLAAGGTVAGVGESALRALSKLDQVMPSRLQSQVAAVHDATVHADLAVVGRSRRTRRPDDARRVPAATAST